MIEDKARELGRARVPRRRRPRAVRRATSSLPAIKANALYGGGYPLFTALGRPLIAQLAVEYARAVRLRHDRPRLHGQGQRPGADRGDGRDPGPGAEDDRPGALLADGARGGDRLRARARHPGQGRHRGRPLLDRRQPLGPLLGGPLDRGPRPRARGRRLPARHPPRGGARRGRRRSRSSSRRASRSRSTASGSGLVELLEAAAEIGCRHGVGIVDHIEDRIVGLKVRDIYEVAGGGDPAHRPPGAREAGRRRSTRTSSSRSSTASGPTSSTRASGGSRCAPTSTPTWRRPTRRSPATIGAAALQGRRPRSSPAPRPTPSTTPTSPPSPSPAASSRRAPRPGFIELWSLQSRMAHRIRERGGEEE